MVDVFYLGNDCDSIAIAIAWEDACNLVPAAKMHRLPKGLALLLQKAGLPRGIW